MRKLQLNVTFAIPVFQDVILRFGGKKHSSTINKLSVIYDDLGTSNYLFVDKITVRVKGGKGGNGCVSYETLTPGKKRASGGGGNGSVNMKITYTFV